MTKLKYNLKTKYFPYSNIFTLVFHTAVNLVSDSFLKLFVFNSYMGKILIHFTQFAINIYQYETTCSPSPKPAPLAPHCTAWYFSDRRRGLR